MSAAASRGWSAGLETRARDANLDLLRASAILMVLVYHVAQRWPTPLPRLTPITRLGEYGVDLFFVLSGWLIGGLLWREHARFGDVRIGRFMARRACRTVPPYLAALAISYLGVYVARREPFDWGYLLFLQNYYERIPFFLVSWSLCIEEHFYLVMPFIALTLARVWSRPDLGLLALAIVPALVRGLSGDAGGPHAFGYHITATHLRVEGLLLGVWAAALRYRSPAGWALLRRMAPYGLAAALAAAVISSRLPEPWHYALFYLAVAAVFQLLLVSVVERGPLPLADTRPVFWIATASYSIYLTHAFTMDIALRAVTRIPPNPLLQLVVIGGLIAIAGAVFHQIVEAPSLVLRHRLVPPRTGDAGPPGDVLPVRSRVPAG